MRRYGLGLENPDPEDFEWDLSTRSAGRARPGAHEREPVWSEVPAGLRALIRHVADECFGAAPASLPLEGCDEVQGDPGMKKAIGDEAATTKAVGYTLVDAS